MKNILIVFALAILFSSCEEKPVVIPPFTPITSGKVVMVEELTGVSCSNCPGGAARLASIQQLYPDNVVIVGIHGELLAEPLSNSKFDFRNQDAIDLENFLGPLPKPSVIVNRVKFEDNFDQWGIVLVNFYQQFIERELEKEQELKISITKEYDEESRELTIDVGVLPLIDLNGDFKITVLLTENNIVDPQKDTDEILNEYVHKHVLREIITEVQGDFFANAMEANKPLSKTYKFTIPDDVNGLWKIEDLEIVSFIANTSGGSEEILQAAESHVLD